MSMLRIRANRSACELEIEGSPQQVAEWWNKLWIVVSAPANEKTKGSSGGRQTIVESSDYPNEFGEYFSEFLASITDVDKILVAGGFVQDKDPEKAFTTKSANQL